MSKKQPEKLDLRSQDISGDKREELLRLFPEARTEGGKIDLECLKAALGETVDTGKERYGMVWPGKADCFRTIQQPSLATLLPCREESVNFDTTENLIIEGDNLEVLKLLQKAYLGKVKMIYIDPPYNTGNDFIYPDNYSESLQTYLEYTGQVDSEGRKFSTNTEADGRFHSKWLNMMYPRLYMARNLLREDGVIVISIDDHESDNLKKLCNEVFGEENFIAQLIWEKGRKNDAKLFSVGHEYLLIFARSLQTLKDKRIVWREEKPGAREIWEQYLQLKKRYGNDLEAIESGLQTWFSKLPEKHPSRRLARYRRVDKFGPWRDDDISWPGGDGPKYDVIHPTTKRPCKVPERGWVYSTSEKMQEMIELGIVEFRKDHTEPPLRKAHIRPISYELVDIPEEDTEAEFDRDEELASQVRGSYFYKQSQVSVKYRDGFIVAEISAEPGNELVRFNNGTVLRLGEELGGMREDIWRTQIRNTVKKHLDKELQVKDRGLKVLSLFFIDRVANYRGYGADGQPVKGKFAEVFEQALVELAKEPRYRELGWLKLPLGKLHDGYFAQDKKGVLKDTRGDTQADDDVYELIMKNKEQLLSLDEPLRFIFSHSALREGWDNPNVFQICTLNETRSAMRKRQEIGRGLRLPVNQAGERVFDESINKLLVIANESYEDFARSLQEEYEEECGVTFGKVPIQAFVRLAHVVDGEERIVGREAAAEIWQSLVASGYLGADGKIQPKFDPAKKDLTLGLPQAHRDLDKAVIEVLSSYQLERHIRKEKDEGPNKLKKQVQLSPEFQALWERIKPRTTYRVEFTTDTLVAQALAGLKKMERIQPAQVSVRSAAIEVKKPGVTSHALSASTFGVTYDGPLPDILAYLQNETELTRSTLVRILKESGRLGEFFVNPQRFMDSVAGILKHELHRLIVDGIKYERIPVSEKDAEWEMVLFDDEELINYLSALHVKKSVYDYIVYDSAVEREFARKLDERDDIRLFVKLPGNFLIDTPVGKYNPDWAIVKHEDETIYMVRETKGTKDFLKLRTSEADKVRCGKKHFQALGVPFDVVESADEV